MGTGTIYGNNLRGTAFFNAGRCSSRWVGVGYAGLWVFEYLGTWDIWMIWTFEHMGWNYLAEDQGIARREWTRLDVIEVERDWRGFTTQYIICAE